MACLQIHVAKGHTLALKHQQSYIISITYITTLILINILKIVSQYNSYNNNNIIVIIIDF
jgi:hypothetical protein